MQSSSIPVMIAVKNESVPKNRYYATIRLEKGVHHGFKL